MLGLKDLTDIVAEHRGELEADVSPVQLSGDLTVATGEPVLMGVVNLSPDSWYRESVCLSVDAAVQRGRVLVEQGAVVVDVGAESSLGQAERVAAAGQQQRLLPVIRQLAEAGVVVSAETYDLEVAEACLAAGAKVLNLTGTAQSEAMYRLAAEHDAAVIVCYVAGENVREVKDFPIDHDPIPRMSVFLRGDRVGGKVRIDQWVCRSRFRFLLRQFAGQFGAGSHQMKTFLNTFRLRKLGWPVCNALPHAFECFGEEVRSAEAVFLRARRVGKTDLSEHTKCQK